MRKLVLILSILLIEAAGGFSQSITINPERLAVPECSACDQVVVHTGFTVGFEKDYRQARYVAYVLSAEETRSGAERTDNFRPDPKLIHPQATKKDYEGSGYDRGHLAPAADMGWSDAAMSESFYFSNMSPQDPGFNRGIWKKLEEQVRGWAVQNGSVIVVTGCVFNSFRGYIGSSLSVPAEYYKVILDYSDPEIKAIGFVLPNKKSSAALSSFACSVDYVESITGLDFFTQLPDSIENQLESRFALALWPFTGFSSSGSSSSTSPSTQCKGKTKSGEQCKNMTKDESGYCHLHSDQAVGSSQQPEKLATSVQCSAKTQSGARCKRMTKSQNGKCWQHGGN